MSVTNPPEPLKPSTTSHSVDSILDTAKFSEWVGLQTNASKTCLLKQLSHWNTHIAKLQNQTARFTRFKEALIADPHFFEECRHIFLEISEIEDKLKNILNTQSKLEKESYNELIFTSPLLSPLNFIPYFLSIWSICRVYILPGLSLMVPIIALILPYFILRYTLNIPINMKNYFSILQVMLSGQVGQIMNSNATGTTAAKFSPINFMKQSGVLIFTFFQSIVQPYWTYKHLSSIDKIIKEHGNLILKFKAQYNQLSKILKSHGFTFFKCPLPTINDAREATARGIIESTYFKIALKYIGSLEIIMCLANKKEINSVHWIKSPQQLPYFKAEDIFDFQVPEKCRKTIQVEFDQKRHALLTGPNKGGKSTVLRSIGLSVLLAHTYGCSLGHVTLTPFNKILACLKPDDLPGSKSRFEREIEFTANTLKEEQPTIILIDELYHSTNPPDALRSCHIYCDNLWKKTNIISIISTHLFEFVENTDSSSIQKLCCPAYILDDGTINFEYTLKDGICKVSSVDELLRRNGLLGWQLGNGTAIGRANDAI